MKKQWMTLGLALCMILTLLPMTALASDGDVIEGEMGTEDSIFGVVAAGTCGPNLKWTFYDDGILSISGSGDMDDYAPLEAPWAAHRDGITRVALGKDVTAVGDNAFHGCGALTQVNLPDDLTRIGAYAFGGCTGLQGTLTIPEAVQKVGEGAFYGTSLTEVTFKSLRMPVEGYPFGEMPALTTIYVPAAAYNAYAAALQPYLPEGVSIVAEGGAEPDAPEGLHCTITDSGAVLRGSELGLHMQLFMAAYDGDDRMVGVTEEVAYADGSYEMTIEAAGIAKVHLFVLDGQFVPVDDVKIFE